MNVNQLHQKDCDCTIMDVPLVSISACCSVARTDLMKIDLSKLILSNSQSKSTLEVRETCFKLGLRPVMLM